MNKLTKVGLSALCGSLAAVSAAQAGEMTITGGVDMSWVSFGDHQTTGNPIGMGSNLTFKGNGELDNGWTFDLTVAMKNSDVYSNTNVDITMGSLGSINFDQGDSGNGIAAYDDKMPTAWEETWGNGLGTGVALVVGGAGSPNMQYTSPTLGGITLVMAVTPDIGAADAGDKATSNTDDGTGAGYDATVNINPDFGTEILSGLNLFVGAHYTENLVGPIGLNDRYEGTGGVTFDIGPVSLGYQSSGILTGKTTTGTDVDYYKNNMYGIAFNINDDLSVSYGNYQSEQGLVNPDNTNHGILLEVDSYQIAYTMGGVSMRYAMTDVSNASYQSTADFDRDANVVSVSLAF